MADSSSSACYASDMRSKPKTLQSRRHALWIHGPLGPLVALLHYRYLIPSLMVFSSALAVVYSKHYARVLNAQSQSLQQKHSLLQAEWRQCLVEYTSWMAKDHIERLAKQQGMQFPEKIEILVSKSSD